MSVLYGKLGLWLSVICVMLDSIGLITIQITAIGFIFKYFFNISYELGILIGFGILTLYSTIGGIRAIAFIDLLQFTIFFIAFPMALGILYHEIGGYSQVINTLPKSYFSILSEDGTIWLFLGYSFYYIMPSISAPNIQRMLMAKNKEQLVKTLNIVAIIFPIFSLIVVILAMFTKAKNPDLEANTVLYYFIHNYLPTGAIGIMVSGMLAVMMSTADSWLNCASSTIAHDFIKKLFPNILEKQELNYARIATVIIAVISVVTALKIQTILELVWSIRNFIFPVIYIPFVAGILGFRTNSRSFITGIISGMLFCFISRYITNEFGIISLCLGKVGSAIGLFGMHYWQVSKGIIGQNKKPSTVSEVPLQKRIISYFKNIKYFKQQSDKAKQTFLLFAVIVLLTNIPLSIFSYHPSDNPLEVAIKSIRILTIALCLFLCFYEYYLPRNKDHFLMLLWGCCLFLCLPFQSAFMLIANIDNTFWIIYFFLSMILLGLFANKNTFLILIIFGVIGAYWLHEIIKSISDYSPLNNNHDLLYSSYSCITMAATLAFFVYNRIKEAHYEEKTLVTLGKSIAHEVNTPLGIALAETNLIRKALEAKNYKKARLLLSEQERIITQGLQDVETILSASNLEMSPKDWGQYSIIETINDALRSDYFTNEEKERIKFLDSHAISHKDFIFTGSVSLLKHITYNLIRNTFKHAGEGATIKIWLENNVIHIKDNGRGMSFEALENMFRTYYTGSKLGHGIGLSFCKEAMKKMKGDIQCYSEIGKGTEFVLIF